MNKSSVSLVFAFIISALALGGCGKIGGPSDEEIAAQQTVTARAEKAEGEARSAKSRAEKAEKALEELKKNQPEQIVGLTEKQCDAKHAVAQAQRSAPTRVARPPQGSPPRATPAPAATAIATATAPAGGTARAEANASSPSVTPVTGGGAQACAWVHPGVAFDGSQTSLANKRFDKPATHTGSCIDFVNEMAKQHGFPTVRKIG